MNKGITMIVLLTWIITPSAYPQWVKSYGGLQKDEAKCLIQTADGGYLIVGQSQTISTGSNTFNPIRILKLHMNGEIEWESNLGVSGYWDPYMLHQFISLQKAFTVQQVQDDGFIIAGATDDERGGGQGLVLKITKSGETEWYRSYGGTQEDALISIKQTTEGGYIAAGWTLSLNLGNKSAWIVKLSSDGQLEWERIYDGMSDDSACCILENEDSGYTILGNTASYGAGGSDIWIMQVDHQGDMLWQKTYGGAADDIAHSIIRNIDNTFMVAGETYSATQEESDSLIFKIDGSGFIEWQKVFQGPGSDHISSIQTTSDGGLIAAGACEKDENSDCLILKISPDGILEWSKILGAEGSDEYANCVIQSTNGHYLITGQTSALGKHQNSILFIDLPQSGEGNLCSLLQALDISAFQSDLVLLDAYASVFDSYFFFEERDFSRIANLELSYVCPPFKEKTKGKDPIR